MAAIHTVAWLESTSNFEGFKVGNVECSKYGHGWLCWVATSCVAWIEGEMEMTYSSEQLRISSA
jgi:hypothetical protein